MFDHNAGRASQKVLIFLSTPEHNETGLQLSTIKLNDATHTPTLSGLVMVSVNSCYITARWFTGEVLGPQFLAHPKISWLVNVWNDRSTTGPKWRL